MVRITRTAPVVFTCRGRRPGWPLLPPPGEVPRRGDRGASSALLRPSGHAVGADALDSSEFGVRSSELCKNVPLCRRGRRPRRPDTRRGALRFASPLWSPARAASPPCLKGGGPQGRGDIDSVDPRGTVLGLADPFGGYEERRIFFLFACPKRKNQRETTLGRGRLRFLPLPRPTLFETPKRGDPLLEHPRAVRIRLGVLRLPGFPAGRGQAPPLHEDGMLLLPVGAIHESPGGLIIP